MFLESKYYKKVVKDIKDHIVSQIPKEKLISLYLGGRILTKDRSPNSDIDFFGIVSDDFDLNSENSLNNFFDKNKKLTGERECRFRAIYISDFQNKTNGKSNIIKNKVDIKLFIKLFRYNKYKLLYGKKINFSKFNIRELSDKEELKLDICFIKSNIDYFKKNKYKEKRPYLNIENTAKWVLHLARLESIINGKSKYEPNFYKIRRKLIKDKEHIFHIAWDIRKNDLKLSLRERKDFIAKVENYLEKIKLLI
jgi:hypothetical protein|tara:strand:- start:3 stop:758 length:756 start_codon:yes stop_codon:yes gene_type:complete